MKLLKDLKFFEPRIYSFTRIQIFLVRCANDRGKSLALAEGTEVAEVAEIRKDDNG